MIPVGAALKAWALTISGFGTVIETDHKQAHKEAKRHEGSRSVTITELSPTVVDAPKTVLLWNELTPGDYWVFHMVEGFIEQDPRPDFACVFIDSGDLFIHHGGGDQKLDDTFARYQFVSAQRPQRSEINFRPVFSETGYVRPTKLRRSR